MDDPRLELLRRTAQLARLALSEEESRTLAPELDAILEHFRVLAEVDTEGVPPCAGVSDLRDVLRPDEPRPSGLDERLLEGAPDRRGRHYGVPRALGGEP
jgi:aspartyl-tRNA(Asn)/glutamyl-tRNA(Gln) amidotransferase subunit C